MSTYILQKNFHTPIGKGLAGDKYIWNGAMYYPELSLDRVYLRLSKEQVENNPEWFKKEEQMDWEKEARIYKLKYNRLLNEISMSDIYKHTHFTDMKYTDVDMEECFNESRLRHPLAGMKYDFYVDYKRYKDSIKFHK